MTRSGIEANLSISPYIFTNDYWKKTIIYRFSSQAALDKFEREKDKHFEELETSLTNRFKMKFKLSREFTDIDLYRKIERRGFHIEVNGVVVRWPDVLEYDGMQINLQLSEGL